MAVTDYTDCFKDDGMNKIPMIDNPHRRGRIAKDTNISEPVKNVHENRLKKLIASILAGVAVVLFLVFWSGGDGKGPGVGNIDPGLNIQDAVNTAHDPKPGKASQDLSGPGANKETQEIEVRESLILYNGEEIDIDELQKRLSSLENTEVAFELRGNNHDALVFEEVEALLRENAYTFKKTYTQ